MAGAAGIGLHQQQGASFLFFPNRYAHESRGAPT